jgi:uncharacterized paraquat-inducible protein A
MSITPPTKRRRQSTIPSAMLLLYAIIGLLSDGVQSSSTSSLIIGAPPDCSDNNNNNTSHRFECWLYQLPIDLPSQKFEKDYVSFELNDLKCTNFQVTSLDSHYHPSSSFSSSNKQKDPVMGLQADGLAAVCDGKYHLTGGIAGKIQVDMQSRSSPGLDLEIQVMSNITSSIKMPAAVETTHCDTQLVVHKVSFTGSISAKLIDLFSKSIEHYINDALKGQICPLLEQNLDPLLTKYIQKFDGWAAQFLLDQVHASSSSSSSTTPPPPPPPPAAVVIQPFLPHNNKSILEHTSHSMLSSGRTLTTEDDSSSIIPNPTDLPLVRYWIDLANSIFRTYLNNGFLRQDWLPAPSEEEQCGFLFRGITGLFRHYTHGRIRVARPRLLQNLHFGLPFGASLSLNMNNLIIEGLDQMIEFQFFEGSDLETTLQSPGWNVSVEVQLQVDRGDNDPLQEHFMLHVNATDIRAVAASLFQAKNWDTLSMYQVVEALQNIALGNNRTQNIACFARTIHKLQIPSIVSDLVLKHASIVPLGSNVHLEKDLDGVVNSFASLILNEYSDMVRSVLKGVVQGPAKARFNAYLESLINRFKGHNDNVCPESPSTTKPHWVNFTQMQFLGKMNDFLNHRHTLDTINDYLECFGRVLLNHRKLDELPMGLISSKEKSGLSLVIRNVEIQHIDSLEALHILNPAWNDSTYLESSFTWGSSDKEVPHAFVSVEVEYPEIDFKSWLNTTLYLEDVELLMGMRMNYNLRQLTNVSIVDLLERAQCIAVPAAELRLLDNTHFTYGGIGINITGLVHQKTLENPVEISVASNDYPFVEQALEESTTSALEFTRLVLNRATESMIAQSSSLCDESNVDHSRKNVITESHVLGLVTFVVFIVMGQVGLYLLIQSDRHRKISSNNESTWSSEDVTESLLNEEHHENSMSDTYDEMFPRESVDKKQADIDMSVLHDIIDEMENESEVDSSPHAFHESLFQNVRVPEAVRLVVPALIAGTVLLLFSSNLSTGASVDLSTSFMDRHLNAPALFTFSLGNTINEMYHAGIYPLLFLVVVFSGIWPYAKLLMMLYLWINQPTSFRQREQRLLLLDSLSKFSLVDTYVLVVMIVAFRYHLEFTTTAVSVDVYVLPHYGFYGFLLATCLSLVIGHTMVYFHRQSQRDITRFCSSEKSIFEHSYHMNFAHGSPKIKLKKTARILILGTYSVTLILLTIGFWKHSFAFEFGGLAGLALGNSRKKSYSLMSLGGALPKSVSKGFGFGIFVLQVAYYFYAVLTPIGCLSLLIVLFIYRCDLRMQRRILLATEIANAWSAVEVFVLSIVAALFQISTFASFIIGDRCDFINRFLREAFGEYLGDDAVCYSVKAVVTGDCWYLITGVLMNSFCVSFGLRLVHCAINERIAHARQELEDNGEEIDESIANEGNPTIVMKLFGSPIGKYLFREDTFLDNNMIGSDGQEENTDGGAENEEEAQEEKEEELPEWRYWF